MNTHYSDLEKGNKNTITVAQVADCIETLMSVPEEVDMTIIESAVNQVMQYNGLKFRDYYDLLHEQLIDERSGLLERFTEVSDYFYDVINAQKISREKLEHLVTETIIFPS